MPLRCRMFLAFIFLLPAFPLAALDSSAAERFIRALASRGPELEAMIHPEDLAHSHRLGIRYPEYPVKALIGAEMDPATAALIAAGGMQPPLRVVPLGDSFSRLGISGQAEGHRGWLFRGDSMVSPVRYFSHGRPSRESPHIRFLAADSVLPGDYAVGRLESFIRETARRLDFSDEMLATLSREKILYLLCKDEDSMERVTGYRARGMCWLAWDCVVSTWSCHYHELAHLLVNYRLGELSADTHPFFLEGLATALGGRGGQEPGVILDLGQFLAQAGVMDWRELLDRRGFHEQDPSLAYPVAGLYNLFLLERLGAGGYLELYRLHNAPRGSARYRETVLTADLPSGEEWQEYLAGRRQFGGVSLDLPTPDGEPFARAERWAVWDCVDQWAFSLADSLHAVVPSGGEGAVSFGVPPPGADGPRFKITADSSEIRLVCIETGNLAANFAVDLSVAEVSIPLIEGRYRFRLAKHLFMP